MVTDTPFADAIGVEPVANFEVPVVKVTRTDRNFVKRLLICKRTQDSVSLCREFLHTPVELVLFEFILTPCLRALLLRKCVRRKPGDEALKIILETAL
ncbi:hypothetical protein SG26_00015 [Haloarcula sp. CBA1115]|nr:hypothetical protein SG26_00015 [Haloarcula sp. CBA1115]KZX50107.1 hypothetical protein AV929_13510 [Haloarcula sp. K1]